MRIYLLNKIKGRNYDTSAILSAIAKKEGAKDVTILRTPEGRPYFAIEGREVSPFFSVSHTRNYWAAVFSDEFSVGFDIEEGSRRVKYATASFFHESERKYLSGLEKDSREWSEEFLSIWTAKESLIKLAGREAALPLNAVSFISGDMWPLSKIELGGRVFRLVRPELGKGLIAAVCIPEGAAEDYKLRKLKFTPPPAEGPKSRAMVFLASRDHSIAEVEAKLIKAGYGAKEARDAAEELRAGGYIDDENYAEIFALRLMQKGRGNRRIIFDLKRKGIDAGSAERAVSLAEETCGAEEDRAVAVAETMLRNLAAYPSSKQGWDRFYEKVARKLAAAGFDSGVSYRAARKARENGENLD